MFGKTELLKDSQRRLIFARTDNKKSKKTRRMRRKRATTRSTTSTWKGTTSAHTASSACMYASPQRRWRTRLPSAWWPARRSVAWGTSGTRSRGWGFAPSGVSSQTKSSWSTVKISLLSPSLRFPRSLSLLAPTSHSVLCLLSPASIPRKCFSFSVMWRGWAAFKQVQKMERQAIKIFLRRTAHGAVPFWGWIQPCSEKQGDCGLFHQVFLARPCQVFWAKRRWRVFSSSEASTRVSWIFLLSKHS